MERVQGRAFHRYNRELIKDWEESPFLLYNKEDMANYIMQIFRAYAMVVFSWGFNAPTAIANGLRFMVQGFKFKGTVEVEYNEGTDLFDVRLIKNGKVVETVKDVYLDSLVDVIDYRVEKVDNYKERIEAEYSINVR